MRINQQQKNHVRNLLVMIDQTEEVHPQNHNLAENLIRKIPDLTGNTTEGEIQIDQDTVEENLIHRKIEEKGYRYKRFNRKNFKSPKRIIAENFQRTEKPSTSKFQQSIAPSTQHTDHPPLLSQQPINHFQNPSSTPPLSAPQPTPLRPLIPYTLPTPMTNPTPTTNPSLITNTT